ncbi:hypothetical protein WN944_027190 [Citrus x changshan-huyou]|uniref:Uncharacterized protein n=1 Tax=Citrus x changshan-huyou TaxID=2935761 RepID=A0AAP0LNA6_9ROSI
MGEFSSSTTSFFRWWAPSREEISEFASQMNLFQEQGIDNNDNNIMNLDMFDFDHRIIKIETLLSKLKKYQFVTMVILVLIAAIIYCNS